MTEWYSEGLSFKCTGCGKCCTGSPGAVWINEDETEAMAQHLNLSKEDFLNKYTRLIDGRRSLIESISPLDPTQHDCIFLKNKQCSIYQVRPVQCRTYPWWPDNLKSEKAWNKEAAHCEGIKTSDVEKVSLKVIKDSLNDYQNARSRS